jgi:hypothetical protein
MSEVQPPHSPDLNPLYFYLLGHSKSLVYWTPIENEETDTSRTYLYACQPFRNRPGTFERTIRRAHACIDSGGRHFEHLL